MTQILIAVPTPGLVATEFMKSIVGLTQGLRKRRVPFALKTYEFSDIVMSRNYLVSYFLSSRKFTHCLLVDSDLSFTPKQLFRLLDFDEDFVAGVYPQRNLRLEKFRQAVEQDLKSGGTATPTRELLARSMKYNLSYYMQKGGAPIDEQRGDFRRTATVATGFMLFKRVVPETIVARGAAQKLPRNGLLPIYQDAPLFADFFSHRYSDEGDAIYGEDQSFCLRWVKDCGGAIWVDTKSRITHHGHLAFPGDFAQSGGP